ncbi:competence protein CoiA family protein [Chloroflexota bacterium]
MNIGMNYQIAKKDSMKNEIFPRWVSVNGQICNVSDFSHLQPNARPKAFCPLCNNPIILKLGSIKVHHYAHKPDVICAITQPETALHLNTKYHIYTQLLLGSRLYLEQECSNNCGVSKKIIWVKDWERVEIESKIGSFRPDILIVTKDGPNHVIEIKVSHPVEDAKQGFYKEENINWAEVDAMQALESFYDGENAWSIEQSLPFAVCKPPLDEWTCKKCLTLLKKEKEDELKRQRVAEYRKHNYEDILYAQLVDYYYSHSGKKYRETYYLKKVVRDDELVGVWVMTRTGTVILKQNGDITESTQKSAYEATKREIDRMCNGNRAIADSRDWAEWVYGKKIYAGNFERYPFRYEWDAGLKKWAKKEMPDPRPECHHEWMPKNWGGAICSQCGTVLLPTKPKVGCTHYFVEGVCKWCGIFDASGFYDDFTFKEGVCIHCGQTTTDYWSFDSKTQKCKCKKCYREGRY